MPLELNTKPHIMLIYHKLNLLHRVQHKLSASIKININCTMVNLKQIELLKSFYTSENHRCILLLYGVGCLYIHIKIVCINFSFTHENYHCNLLYVKLVAFSYRYKHLVSVSGKVQTATLCFCKAIWQFTWYSLKNRKLEMNNSKVVICSV
jgi:hypothetical protein